MDTISIKHITEEAKFVINFDKHDGSIPFSSIELNVTGDVDLNPLVIELAKLIEDKRILQFEFDDNEILTTNSKIALIKSTLDEIYTKFNENIQGITVMENFENMSIDVPDGTPDSWDVGDLPF